MHVNQINNNTVTSITNENTQEQIDKHTNKQIEEQRLKTFFTPIKLGNTNLDDAITIVSDIENNSFYTNLKTTDCSKLKIILINELNEFIELNKYYCGNKHVLALEKLIQRIKSEFITENATYLEQHFSNISYWIHELILVLNNFKYQLEQQDEISASIIISKEAIALRLDECIVDLDKCWDGICARFINEYEIFSSLKQGIAGKINIIKKDLFDAVLREYLNKQKKANKDLFLVGNETHIRNDLNNLMQEILGVHNINDRLEDNESLPLAIKNEFMELIQLEVSPAKITSVLADELYQLLTVILKKISMFDWLTKYKIDEQLTENIMELDTKFFAPINALFNVAEQDRLNIHSILDITEENETTKYILNRSREKLHLWVCSCLMPNTEKVFISNIADNLTIASIDYMFFWVCDISNKLDNKIHYDTSNHISLQLSHIQQLDFIDFIDIDKNEHCFLSSHIKKTEVSISLITQAMQQTHYAKTMVNFFIDTKVNTLLNKAPILLKDKLHNILNDKLLNASFKQQFVNETKNYYSSKNIQTNRLTINQTYWLLNNYACADILIELIEQNINIDYLIDKINTKYLDEITTEVLVITPNSTKELLFIKAFIDNNCDFMYKLFCTNDCNEYINYNSITSNETPFSLAIIHNHLKLVKLLLADKSLNIDNCNLYYSFIHGNHKIISLCIQHILNSTNFNLDQKLELIQAKDTDGFLGLSLALEKGHDIVVKEYISLILDSNEFNSEQKLEIIQAKDTDGFYGLYIALQNGHDKVAKEYISLILDSNEFNSEQKLEIIQAKDTDGFSGLYIALQNGHDKVAKEYITLILASDEFNIEQKLELIQATNKNGFPGLYIALQEGHDTTVTEYLRIILASNAFNPEQKLELIQAKNKDGFPGLYIALKKGHNAVVKEYINLILTSDVFITEQELELIQAKDADGWPGLYLALRNVHNTVAKEYITLILASDKFNIEQKLELIQATNKDGFPGLYIALQEGNDITVKEYIRMILASNAFNPEQKLKLIQAKNKYGFPGLYIALKHGHDAVVKEYINLILTSDVFITEQKLELIQAKDTDGWPGLYIALQNGHDAVVKEYINLILTSDVFITEQKLELIQAKNQDGWPGLYIALQNVHDTVAKEYITLILASNKFNLEQKLQLIKATNQNGFPGLYLALQEGNDITVKEYIRIILASNAFNAQQKLELIQAKNKDGFPGLHIALKRGHDAVVKEYITLILTSDLFSTEQKLEIIQAKNKDSFPGLYVALQNGHDAAVKEYMDMILASNEFNIEQKLEIIQAQDKDGKPGLYIAFQHSYYVVITIYMTIILASDVFNKMQKLKLIQAKNKNGYPVLYMVLKNAYRASIKEYINIILNSNKLDFEYKKILLITRARRWVGYTDLVYASNLTDEEKNILLKPSI